MILASFNGELRNKEAGECSRKPFPRLAVKTRLVEISWELVDGFVFEMEILTSYPHDNRFLRCGKEINNRDEVKNDFVSRN